MGIKDIKKLRLNNEQKNRIKKIAVATLGTFIFVSTSAWYITRDSYKAEDKEATISLLIENDKTLNIYNSYLEKMGSQERLTVPDLNYISLYKHNNSKNILIKLANGEYGQVSTDSYSVVENEKGLIRLINNYNIREEKHDLFTKEIIPKTEKFINITLLDDYIYENDIKSTGFAPAPPGWSDEDKEFILKYYNEDVWECLKENGFPIPVYEVNDFLITSLMNKQGMGRTL